MEAVKIYSILPSTLSRNFRACAEISGWASALRACARGLKTVVHAIHNAKRSASSQGGLGGIIPPSRAFSSKAAFFSSFFPFPSSSSPSLFSPLFATSLLTFLALLLCFTPAKAQAAPEKINVGFRTALAWYPDQSQHIDMAVWYPCNRGASTITIGDYSFEAARNAAPLPGKFPLIVLTHDSTGSRFSHRDMAIMLARRGFVVAAPTMADDNETEMRLLFSSRQWPERARQLTFVLDELLKNPNFASMIDARRVGVFGFGNGGSAALMLAGARPLSTGWAGFCRQNAQDPYCTSYLGERMGLLARAMEEDKRELVRAREEYARVQKERADITQKAEAAHKAAVDKAQRQKKPEPEYIAPDLPELPEIPQILDVDAIDFTDTRVKAIGIFSPGMVFFWDTETLKNITIPLLFIGAEKDTLNVPQAQAASLVSRCPKALYVQYPEGTVLDMQSACPRSYADILPELCNSVDAKTRQQRIEQLEKDVAAFFTRAFM